MNKRPDVFKPITDEQLRALSEKNGWVGKERGVEPEEVGITKEMQRAALHARLEQAMVEGRNAIAPSEYFLDKCAAELPRQKGLENTTATPSRTDLDALRAFITPSTAAQAREREAADERESNEQFDGFGEDPTPLDQFLREQRLKPISEEQHAAIAAAEPATRGAVVESILNGPSKLEALRAIIGGTTDEQARASMAAYETENSGKGTGYGEDPTDWEAYQREREELEFLQHRDASVTDAQLIERMNNAPDMGGSIIAEHLARETGVPAEILRTLAGISDPKNEHQFTAEAARNAFAGVEVLRRVTKPRTVAEAVTAAVRRYGTAGRENVSNDDASGPGPSRRNFRGVDVRSLTPTPPMTEDEKAARYKAGRIAEMTEHQAGLWLLPPNPGAFGTLEQWQAWRQELLALGPETAGADVELKIADKVIAGMLGCPE